MLYKLHAFRWAWRDRGVYAIKVC